MTSTQGRTIVAVILAGALTLAGCGGDDDAAPTADDVSTSTAPSADEWDPAVAERCGHISEGILSTQWSESAAAIESWASHWQEHPRRGTGRRRGPVPGGRRR